MFSNHRISSNIGLSPKLQSKLFDSLGRASFPMIGGMWKFCARFVTRVALNTLKMTAGIPFAKTA